jgi:hypothetical protein
MRQSHILAIVIATAFACASADGAERRAHPRKRAVDTVNVGILDMGGGSYYYPHYGRPTYPSYWYGPATGVYAVDPGLCYAQRASPGWLGIWYWSFEHIC